MILPVFLAALAAVPAVSAQANAVQAIPPPAVTSSGTRCTTRFGFNSLTATGTESTPAVPTWYTFTTQYNVFSINSTTHSTVTATPDATTISQMVTTTATVEVTTTVIPPTYSIAAPSGFMPLFAAAMPEATGVSRIKRAEIGSRDILSLFKRQTPASNTGGFSVDEDGNTTELNRQYIQRVDCMVTHHINSTVVNMVTGPPETVYLGASTAVAVSTSTVSTTVTVTTIAPTPSTYAACQPNNIINSITDANGNKLIFKQVIYRPAQGFPRNTEMIVNTTSPLNCCIACQNTPNCAASFYVPSKRNCHIRLTEAAPMPAQINGTDTTTPPLGLPYPAGNATNAVYPAGSSASGLVQRQAGPTAQLYASGTGSYGPVASGTYTVTNGTSVNPANGFVYPVNSRTTCSKGSLSLYIGAILGTTTFPIEKAISFNNGPCGYYSVWPLPLVPGQDWSYDDPVPSREHPWDRI